MTSILYSLLNQRNQKHDHETIKKLECLFRGEPEINRNASLFIRKDLNETERVYQARLDSCVYHNYFGAIINHYASSLFHKGFSVQTNSTDDFWREFQEDCDLRGTSIQSLVSDVFINALVYGKSYLAFDFPCVDELPETLAAQQQSNQLRAYLVPISNECLIDWSKDETTNEFTLAVVRNTYTKRQKLTDTRDLCFESFTVWEKDQDSGAVSCSKYEISYKPNSPPNERTMVPMVSHTVTSFKRIPIVTMKLPSGKSIGQSIMGVCAEHFTRHSALVNAEAKSLNATKVFTQGAELPADGSLSVIAEDTNRGERSFAFDMTNKGFLVLGPNDKVGYLEPTGTAYELVDKQLKELADKAYVLAGIGSASPTASTSAVAKSGLSKKLDRQAMNANLGAFAEIVRHFINVLYRSVSEARQEDLDFSVKGLDDFDDQPLEELLAVSPQLTALNIPSAEFQKRWLAKVAKLALDKVTPEEEAIIAEQISQAIDSGKHATLDSSLFPEDDEQPEDEEPEPPSQRGKAEKVRPE